MRAAVVPSRARRLARLQRGPVRSGLLGVNDATALSGVGFEPLSEVIGAAAFISPDRSFFAYGTGVLYAASHPAGWQGTPDGGEPVVLTSSTQHDGRVPTAITAMKSGYRLALSRLTEELVRLEADGAVGVRVAHTTIEQSSTEREVWNFLATGTAVRSTGQTRATKPFTSALGGAQTATALRGGWLPLRFLACPVMAVRWIEPSQRQLQRRRSPNNELRAYTQVVNAARHQARTDFARAATAAGGAGAIMSDMTLDVRPGVGVAQATVLVTGTAVSPFGRAPAPEVRTAVSLLDGHGRI